MRILSSFPKTRSGVPGAFRQRSSMPARRAFAWVRPHSAPVRMTTSRTPFWISSALSVSTDSTASPPHKVIPVSAWGQPRVSASARAGSSYGHMPRSTRTASAEVVRGCPGGERRRARIHRGFAHGVDHQFKGFLADALGGVGVALLELRNADEYGFAGIDAALLRGSSGKYHRVNLSPRPDAIGH